MVAGHGIRPYRHGLAGRNSDLRGYITAVCNIRVNELTPDGMSDRIPIIKHEAVPGCGSFEVRFPDDRPSQFFYWDGIPARRLRPDLMDRETALEQAKAKGHRDSLICVCVSVVAASQQNAWVSRAKSPRVSQRMACHSRQAPV